MAVTSPAVVALEGSLYVTGGAILEDGDGIELVQRSVRSRIAGFRQFFDWQFVRVPEDRGFGQRFGTVTIFYGSGSGSNF
jgi:hypothetical protein